MFYEDLLIIIFLIEDNLLTSMRALEKCGINLASKK